VLVLSPGEYAEEAASLLEDVQKGERVERVETERVAKDWRLLRLLVSVSPIYGRNGGFAGAVGIYRDLSEQRDAEDALRASEPASQRASEPASGAISRSSRPSMRVW
jgi:PAS domain S-box-containing protein